jgi:signal transduction histidine kinase
MPEQLLKNGLATALQDLAISIPNAKFTHFGDDRRLNQDIEVVLYRCAYELVNNAIKHAKASHIDLQLMQENHQVTLTVSDNGYGMKNEEPAKTEETGMGLQSIRERISHYRGTMNIIDKEGQGTEINIILPA